MLLTALAALSGCGDSPTPQAERAAAFVKAVPKPDACGPNDRVETGLQGQVPAIDRASGRSQEGYNCNLELVGQVQGEGAGWQFAWFEDCGYMNTANGDGQAFPGVVVIDASDSTNPRAVGHLDTIAMLDPWESLKVNEKRKLLAAVNGLGGDGGPELDVYDLSEDCRHPKLLASTAVAPLNGHAGNFAPDGMTYYFSALPEVFAIDITDPTSPRQVGPQLPGGSHDLSLNEAGTRAYFAQLGLVNVEPAVPSDNGLIIVDTSDIQARRENAEPKIVGQMFWQDGAGAQMTQPIKIAGKEYLLFVDEGISGANQLAFCGQMLPPYAMARLLDVSDEANPRLVTRFALEVHDPLNCALTVNDDESIFEYDSHYCSVDDPENATMLACSQFASGLRVFDIRDPENPREIAYYNPPAQALRQNSLPGSNHIGAKTVDWTTAHPRFRLDRSEIWFTSQDNGFQIVRFTNGVWPFPDTVAPADPVLPAGPDQAESRFGGALLPLTVLALALVAGLRRRSFPSCLP